MFAYGVDRISLSNKEIAFYSPFWFKKTTNDY